MSNEKQATAPQKTASQRLQDLENAVGQLYGVLDNMSRDLTLLKNASKLLDNKLSSVVKASSEGQAINDEVIGRIMLDNSVAELTNKVTNMVLNNILVPEEEVGENSFVIGQELEDNAEAKVINPRLQFALKALDPKVQAKILGAKPGQVVKIEEGKFDFKVLETYKIQDPKPAEAPAPAATPEGQDVTESDGQAGTA